MTTSLETELRRELHRLATSPAPANLSERALAGARQIRRRRGIVAALAAVAVAGVVTVPILVGRGPASDPTVGSASSVVASSVVGTPSQIPSVACQFATDEASPPVGAPSERSPPW